MTGIVDLVSRAWHWITPPIETLCTFVWNAPWLWLFFGVAGLALVLGSSRRSVR